MLLNKMYQLGNNGLTIDWSVAGQVSVCEAGQLRQR